MTKKELTREELQENLENLLKEIRDFVGNNNYIFRGENKNYGRITSKLYRYFKTILGRALLQNHPAAQNLKFNINPIKKKIESQFGKKALSKIDFHALQEYLKETILDQLAQIQDNPLYVEDIQKELILKEVQEYIDFENEDDTLTELQHYGGSTNLIDFSHDIAIALFFACDGEPKENGRLIIIKVGIKDVIYPKKNQNNRTIFQKSVFLKNPKGYIDEEDAQKIVIIPQSLKPLLLTYVQNYFNIRTETVYGDLIGYIQNQEMHREAFKQLFSGSLLFYAGKMDEAINCYDEAIKLNPNFAEAYRSRSVIYRHRGIENKDTDYDKAIANYDRAIADCDRAIEINPNFVDAYMIRGFVYRCRGDINKSNANYNQAIADNNEAIANYDRVVETNPNHADAYRNRGIVYRQRGDNNRANANSDGIADYDQSLSDINKAIEINQNYADAYFNRGVTNVTIRNYDNAEEDLYTALELAKKQKIQDVADYAQRIINGLPKLRKEYPPPLPTAKSGKQK